MDVPKGGLGKLEPEAPVKRKRPTALKKAVGAPPAPVPVAKPVGKPLAKKKPGVKVAAKKASKPLSKGPKFLCDVHKRQMVFSSDLGFWYCPEDGCHQTRKAQVGGDADTVTKVTGTPKLVVRNDKDGDPHYYLHYEAQNLMVEFPFTAVIGHQVFARSMSPSVVFNVKVEDFVFLDEKGDAIALQDIRDR